jgi:hypothetical protein
MGVVTVVSAAFLKNCLQSAYLKDPVGGYNSCAASINFAESVKIAAVWEWKWCRLGQTHAAHT